MIEGLSALHTLLKQTTMLEGNNSVTRQGNILSFDEAKAQGALSSDARAYSRPSYASRRSSSSSRNSSRSTSRTSSRTSASSQRASSRVRSQSSDVSAGRSRSALSPARSQAASAPSGRSRSHTLSTDYPARRESGRGVSLQARKSRSHQSANASFVRDHAARMDARSDSRTDFRDASRLGSRYDIRGDERTDSRTTARRDSRMDARADASHSRYRRSDNRLRSVSRDSALQQAQREDYLADREKQRLNEEEETPVQDKRKKTLAQRLRGLKASRAYNKVFGSQDASAPETSRAALYEMRMGRTHRRSSRMQDSADGKGGKSRSFTFSPLALLASIASSQRATRVFLCVCGVVFACVMLYGPCASYYTEVRSVQQLQAEYEALQEYNQEMQSQIDYLNTDEGMEEYIRSELGWIRSDEHMMTVEGLSPSAQSQSASDTSSELSTVPTDNVKAPDTWYSGVLDTLFGYQG